MSDFFYKETAVTRLKGAEKAAIFLGEMDPGTASIITGFLSTNEIKQIRKSLKKMGTTVNIQNEIAVLSEALKRGMLKGIAPSDALESNPPMLLQHGCRMKNSLQSCTALLPVHAELCIKQSKRINLLCASRF